MGLSRCSFRLLVNLQKHFGLGLDKPQTNLYNKSMKKLILVFVLLGTLTASAKTNVLSGIKWSSFKGANKSGQCAPYAMAVTTDLHKRGIAAWYLEYDWKSGTRTGAHAVVVFHTDELWYTIDNEFPSPSKVKHDDDFEKMVRQRYPHVVKVRCALTIGNPSDLLTLFK